MSEAAPDTNGKPITARVVWLSVLIVLVFTKFVWVRLEEVVFVTAQCGWEAYSEQGVRMANWKQGLLTNGVEIPLRLNVARLVFDVLGLFVIGLPLVRVLRALGYRNVRDG
jgi:hypothetical protein